MDELMLMDYLKNSGVSENASHSLINKFKEFINQNKEHMRDYRKDNSMFDDFSDIPYRRNHYNKFLEDPEDESYNMSRKNRMFHDMKNNDFDDMPEMGRDKRTFGNEHFNESYAKYAVSNMYHFENGRKYVGEKFDMFKAKEICERYRGIIPHSVTHADVYVAINTQYHLYCDLFKSWFGNDVEKKIIESAIVFWFKDPSYKGESKLFDYFKDK